MAVRVIDSIRDLVGDTRVVGILFEDDEDSLPFVFDDVGGDLATPYVMVSAAVTPSSSAVPGIPQVWVESLVAGGGTCKLSNAPGTGESYTVGLIFVRVALQ